MINTFLNLKTKHRNSNIITVDNIKSANKILFSIFTRYGDTIISLVVIKEFIEQYPDKKYLFLIPKQMAPYMEEVLPSIKYIALNKRNIFDMLKAHRVLKSFKADIGFNPWSNGLDSCYFLTYCKQYLCYRDYKKPKIINHYSVVRNYLAIKDPVQDIATFTLQKDYQNILICPQSTDYSRSLEKVELTSLIIKLKSEFPSASITIAAMEASYFNKNYTNFKFNKNADSSKNFIDLIKNADLIVCVDSGPLHISLAMKKHTIAIFKSTDSNIVINTHTTVLINKFYE